MNGHRLRALLGRLRDLESADARRVDWEAWRRDRAAKAETVMQKLRDLIANAPAPLPWTDARIDEAAAEAREKFELRRQELTTGPRAELLAHLTAIGGMPDARRFETPDAYSAAIRAWHLRAREDRS